MIAYRVQWNLQSLHNGCCSRVPALPVFLPTLLLGLWIGPWCCSLHPLPHLHGPWCSVLPSPSFFPGIGHFSLACKICLQWRFLFKGITSGKSPTHFFHCKHFVIIYLAHSFYLSVVPNVCFYAHSQFVSSPKTRTLPYLSSCYAFSQYSNRRMNTPKCAFPTYCVKIIFS